MFSIKRSAATFGIVVAGLLAAAGPASAQALPGVVGVKAPTSAAGPGSISGEEMTKAVVSVKAPGSANVPAQLSVGTAEVFELNTFGGNDTLRANSGEVAVESVTQARNLNDVEAIDFNALGTQVGSEGVTAPTKADDQKKDTIKAVVVLIGANDYGFAAPGTQIAIED